MLRLKRQTTKWQVGKRPKNQPVIQHRSYLTDPVGYAREVLRVQPTPAQEEIALAILSRPYKVKAPSGHNVGKTFLAAWLVNWWYDTRDPGVVITTAPTQRDVVDLLWTEIRLQRTRAGLPSHFTGPRAPEMRTSDEHYAKGYTARLGQSFQGRHRERMLFVFDEDEGVEQTYWTAAKTMFQADGSSAWLCIGNPTTNDSQSALEELATDRDGSPAWKIVRLSSLDHPNIAEQLAGRPPPIKDAVQLGQVDQWVQDWCEPIPADQVQPGDVEWRPGSGRWYRPGPIAEARMLGRRPSQGTYGVWPLALFERAVQASLVYDVATLPEIGCDVARFGDDWTCTHHRWGPVSLGHAAANGWSTTQTAGHLIQLARQLAALVNSQRDPKAEPVRSEAIPIKVDDDGVGGGVVDVLNDAGYTVYPVNAGRSARKPLDYPNRRSELWFDAAARARGGQLDLSRLPRDVLQRLRQQALAPVYTVDAAGRRVVEPKEKTKERLGRSPDDMDAVNLAYSEPGSFEVVAIETEQRSTRPQRETAAHRRGIFGR